MIKADEIKPDILKFIDRCEIDSDSFTDDDFNTIMESESLTSKMNTAIDIHDGIELGLEIGFKIASVEFLIKAINAHNEPIKPIEYIEE